MRRKLTKMSVDEIFLKGDLTTEHWLRNQGFSQKFINRFFYPLFSGIFLESELRTNERLFKFVFRTMSKGDMVLPKKGIQAIPNLLAQNIPKEESLIKSRFYLGFYFTLPKRFKRITPAMIKIKPIVP